AVVFDQQVQRAIGAATERDLDDAAAVAGERVFETIGDEFVKDEAKGDGRVEVQGSLGDAQVGRDPVGRGVVRAHEDADQAADVFRKIDAGQAVRLVEHFVDQSHGTNAILAFPEHSQRFRIADITRL